MVNLPQLGQNFSVGRTLILVSHFGQVNLNGGTLPSGIPSFELHAGQVTL